MECSNVQGQEAKLFEVSKPFYRHQRQDLEATWNEIHQRVSFLRSAIQQTSQIPELHRYSGAQTDLSTTAGDHRSSQIILENSSSTKREPTVGTFNHRHL